MAASLNRKTSTKTKTAAQPDIAVGATLNASAGNWQPHDYQVRQTALDNAVRVLGGTTTSPGIVLKAAETFYGFLTGK